MTARVELEAQEPSELNASAAGRPPAEGERSLRSKPSNTGFRADIQALRAIAVLAVVINHLWPDRLTGGYVGVDVFFVISGFLISSHIGREIVRTGRVRLGRFYARRIRRLLPAAFLVLIFSLVAAYFLLSSWFLVVLVGPAVGFLANGLRGAGQGLAIAILVLVGVYLLLTLGALS